MSTFKEIVDRLVEGNLGGDEIASYRSFCAAWLYRYYEELGQLSSTAALWLTGNREKYKSQAECERAWEATEQGQRQILVKNLIRGLEHVQETLTSLYFMAEKEAKEANRS